MTMHCKKIRKHRHIKIRNKKMPIIYPPDDITAKSLTYILSDYFKHKNKRMLCKVDA